MSRTLRLSAREKLDINQQQEADRYLEQFEDISRKVVKGLVKHINTIWPNMQVKWRAVDEYCKIYRNRLQVAINF